MFWIGLFLGIFIGGIIGLTVGGLCNAAAKSDLAMDDAVRTLDKK